MKKYLLLVLMCSLFLFLTGCGNKTKLTVENYEKYLDVYAMSYCDGYTDYSDNCTVSLYVEGKPENFNYNDVEVTANINVTYAKYTRHSLGGYSSEGTGNVTLEKVNSGVTDITGFAKKYDVVLPLNGYYAHSRAFDEKVEVISVKGYVTPA